MLKRGLFYSCACTLTLLFSSSLIPAYADDVDRVRQLRSSDQILPLSKILAAVESRYPGTLLNVELEDEHNRIIYEIEVLGSDHVIRQINVDARNGTIIDAEHN
ncbi:PepSY domain-containing protein [Mariprofundus ferrooxydans]|nr:PepSY domain-containing protein [Mariprofundus ferrooxydans]